MGAMIMPRLDEVLSNSVGSKPTPYDHVSETEKLLKNHGSKKVRADQTETSTPKKNELKSNSSMLESTKDNQAHRSKIKNKMSPKPKSYTKEEQNIEKISSPEKLDLNTFFKSIIENKLSSNEIYVLIALFQKCKDDPQSYQSISLTQLNKLTGVGSSNLPRVLNKLHQKGAIFKKIDSGVTQLKLNTEIF